MKNFAEARKDILDVVQFEQWLRFYFTEDKDGELSIKVPAERMAEIDAEVPHLARLAHDVDGQPLTYETSCESVCSFLAAHLDGGKHKMGAVEGVLAGQHYKLEMYLFNLWNQTHEEMLDQEYKSFAQWQELYKAWRESDQVRSYVAQLTNREAPTSQTVQ